MPGYDRATKEIVRRFAETGLRRDLPEPVLARGARAPRRTTRRRPPGPRAACPTSGWSATSAAPRRYLRALPDLQRQGRRDRLLLRRPAVGAGRLQPRPGRRGRLLRRVRHRHPPPDFPVKVTNLVDQLPNLRCPLLGLFGNEDKLPVARTQVDELDRAAERPRQGPTSSTATTTPGTRSSPSTGPSYRVEAANDGWERIADFFGRTCWGADRMCTYAHRDSIRVDGSAQGSAAGWFRADRRDRLLRPPGARAWPSTRSTSTSPTPARGPSARVAVELTAASARELVAAIEARAAPAPPAGDRTA